MNFWGEGNNFYNQKTKIKQQHLRIYFPPFIPVPYEQNKIIKNVFPAVLRLSFSSFYDDEYHIRELLTQNLLFWRDCLHILHITAHGYVRGKDPAHLCYAHVHVLTHIHCAMDKEVSVCPCSRSALAIQGQHARAQERTYLAFTSSNPLQDYPECRFILCTVATIANVILDTNIFYSEGFL